jgi:cytochrome c-type protein NapB
MTDKRDSKRVICILGVTAAMVVVVVLIGNRLTRDEHGRHRLPESVDSRWAADAEPTRTDTFADRRTTLPADMPADPTAKVRDLASYYSRRAYVGAPPHIPHEVSAENALEQTCNTCHERGGYVPKWQAYAPVTPHPQYLNCTQCHVENRTDTLFVETDWQSPPPPDLHRPALPGNPPPIPHELQLRSDCLSCHSGPHAPVAYRTSHPERLNCRQCHTPRETEETFDRGVFTSPALPDVGVPWDRLSSPAAQDEASE